MIKHLRRNPIALLALFLALGGTSYAAGGSGGEPIYAAASVVPMAHPTIQFEAEVLGITAANLSAPAELRLPRRPQDHAAQPPGDLARGHAPGRPVPELAVQGQAGLDQLLDARRQRGRYGSFYSRWRRESASAGSLRGRIRVVPEDAAGSGSLGMPPQHRSLLVRPPIAAATSASSCPASAERCHARTPRTSCPRRSCAPPTRRGSPASCSTAPRTSAAPATAPTLRRPTCVRPTRGRRRLGLTPDEDEGFERELARRTVHRALNRLPHEYRTLIRRRHLHGAPRREIASALGMTVTQYEKLTRSPGARSS